MKARSLAYWRTVRWEFCERHVSIYQLVKEYQDIMVAMVQGAVQGQQNLYSVSIPDLRKRFMRIVEYLGQTGKLPKPPALLWNGSGLSIMDGNHRMAAYFYCYEYFNLPVDHNAQMMASELQQYWIGSVNTPSVDL